MKTKLIKLSKTHYIVVDDSEIKDCYYYNSLDKVIRFGNNLNHPYHYKITHSTKPLEGVGKLSLKNCQAIERGYDLDELAKNWVFELNGHKWSNNDDTAGDNYGSFMAGAKTILAIFMDKKFSNGQMLNAMDLVWEWMNGEEYGCETLTEVQDKHIQSLKQTEWDVIVEMECVIGCQNLILNGENSVCCGDKKPKISEDGCLILKRI